MVDFVGYPKDFPKKIIFKTGQIVTIKHKNRRAYLEVAKATSEELHSVYPPPKCEECALADICDIVRYGCHFVESI